MKPFIRNVLLVVSTPLLVIAAAACSVAPPSASKPTVRIVSPAQDAEVSTARDVQVMASAQDPNGIVRLELWVDGTRATTLQPPSPQTDYTVLLPWTANGAGDHSLCVRAVNQAGASADSALVTVKATAGAGLNSVPTLTSETPPTLIATAWAAAPVSPSATSTSLATLVATVPSSAPSTLAPVPANTPIPQIAPGLYVTAIQVDPTEPKSTPAQFWFHVTFLNSTGAALQLPRWRVLIYRPDGKKPMGDPRGVAGSAAPGTSEQVTQPWQIKVMGCEPFFGKTVHENEGGGLTPFLKPDGTELTISFQVCS